MILTTFSFFVFLCITLLLYYSFGHFIGCIQKYILLFMSIVFYFSATDIPKFKVLVIICYIIGVTYNGAILINKAKSAKLHSFLTFLTVALLVAVLFLLKYAFNLGSIFLRISQLDIDISFLEFTPLLGISYYTLSAIGYVLDVSWETYEAEKNPFKIALFILFFPQMISGPFTRYGNMKEQLFAHHKLDYDTFAAGLRRMLYGYFKKLVISERFALIVTGITNDYSSYAGIYVWVAMAAYGVRLYTDFSGCMDIVLGIAQMFGIKLPENFNAPFSSRTIQEFWQRWHITLGTWFKDYFMYPVQKSGPFVKLGKKCRKRFGKKVGKKIPLYLAMFFLWVLLGIWHGGTINFLIGTGLLQFVYIVVGDIISPYLKKWRSTLHINDDSIPVVLFQRARTYFLMMFCFLCFMQSSFTGVLSMLKHGICNFVSLQPLTFCLLGLGKRDMILMMVGLVVLFIEGYYQRRNTSIHDEMNKKPIAFRYLITCFEVLIIMCYAVIGQSQFIYYQF